MVWLEVVVCSSFGNIEKKQLGGKRATGTLFDGADAIYICKASPGLCAVEVLWLKAWGFEELASVGSESGFDGTCVREAQAFDVPPQLL